MCHGSDVIRLQNLVTDLQSQIRDLEHDLVMCQPRQSTETIPPTKTKLTRQQARLIADKLGVSERTVWRRLDAGKLTVDDIKEE